MTHTVHMSTDTLTSLDQASGYELITWVMHVRSRACPPPKTFRCTVEQVERIVIQAASAPRPKVEFGMEASILGLPIEWVTDPTETTAFEGRTMAAVGNVYKVGSGGLRDSIVKLSTYATIPNELLNPTPPSEEDAARWRAEAEARRAREDTRHTELLDAGGVVAAVAGLHSPDDSRDCQDCQSGDFMASWPCATWDLLDEHAPPPSRSDGPGAQSAHG